MTGALLIFKVCANDPPFSLNLLVLDVVPKSTYTFKVPDVHFPLVRQCVQAYYADFAALLSKAMGLLAPDNSLLLARYFYLRGLVHLMQGQLLSALLDFQNLYKTDIRIFPADLVKGTVASMSTPERAQAERTPELKRLITEVLDKSGEAPKADDPVKNFELPKQHMQLDDFVKRVQESGIVKDTTIIHRLFDALTVGKRSCHLHPLNIRPCESAIQSVQSENIGKKNKPKNVFKKFVSEG